MQQSILKPVLVFILVLAALSSCRQEKVNDTKSPAWNIHQSEKLSIPEAVQLPQNLPAGNSRVLTLYAEGVQKYKARVKPGSDPVSYEWVFVAPQADLFNAQNKKVGTHSAGPSWQLFGGQDSIFAQAMAPPRTAPSNEPATIDWLLLVTKTGTVPTGVFAEVAYIQRIATQGGKAPVTAPASEHETVNVPYTAVYRFSKKN